MKCVARKKIVFIIVEGPSDDEAIGTVFSKILNSNEVYIHIAHGDITTQTGTNSSNILSKIGKIVQKYAKDNHFRRDDFKEIIHIVDTDGTYIPDEKVIEDKFISDTIYYTERIVTSNKNKIVNRNKQKSEVLEKLKVCKNIWTSIPYSCYYMSCNLDHVLYDEMNSTDDEKENNALKFARKYRDNINDFILFITESDFAVIDDYSESWKYIKEELHSLERNTNLGIYLLPFKTINISNNIIEKT